MIRYNGQLKYFKWNRRKEVKRQRKGKKRPRKNIYYIDDILTFDIETTSAWMLEDGSIIPYEVGHPNEWWNKQKPLAIMYIWQFSVNDTVYYGRTWKEFLLLLKDLPGNCQMKIWVHNLSFEYSFMESVLHFNKVFARTPHKPINASCIEFPTIEFCCSYTLTNMSLESWGKKLGLPKMVGDLDYEKIRTPLTELTDVEMGYCQRDCEVVYAGIKDFLKRYKDQWDIPMTSTGQIRRVIKDMLTSDPDYVRWIKKLVPKDAEEYRRALKVFAGGYTHANRIHAGSTVYPEDT